MCVKISFIALYAALWRASKSPKFDRLYACSTQLEKNKIPVYINTIVIKLFLPFAGTQPYCYTGREKKMRGKSQTVRCSIVKRNGVATITYRPLFVKSPFTMGQYRSLHPRESERACDALPTALYILKFKRPGLQHVTLPLYRYTYMYETGCSRLLHEGKNAPLQVYTDMCCRASIAACAQAREFKIPG